jgi:outer membrane protein OmpA-like peptidoglycan-associated protein
MRTAILISVLALAACAPSKPPRELVDARAAYQQAASTPGSTLAQADLYDARQALGRAEAKFSDDGDKQETRDLAYVAKRKAQIAQARAGSFVSMEQARAAQAEREQLKQERLARTSQELERAKGQLAQNEQVIMAERQARAAADQRARDALAGIKGIETRLEDRGLVLTLGSGILFATNKSQLMAGGQERLARVADVIKKDRRPIIVVGHTDSTGTDSRNAELSRERAESVRAFLAAHGVQENRMQIEGLGASQPVADNAKPEGRALNRRVEIVLSNQGGQQ